MPPQACLSQSLQLPGSQKGAAPSRPAAVSRGLSALSRSHGSARYRRVILQPASGFERARPAQPFLDKGQGPE